MRLRLPQRKPRFFGSNLLG